MTVFDIENYREACKFLQKKYDKLGYIRKDYYHKKEAGGLTKTGGTGYGNAGLQYHHICEDIVPSLSDKTVAENNKIEYQYAENMCYCNLLEHAWLHILITENNTDASDEDQEDLTGRGGVRWMLLALNSIMYNKDTSWYSSKNEEGKGCNYNVKNIITKNKKIYLKLINRYCTSAFIRQRLGKTNIELAEDLCQLCRKDSDRHSALNEIMAQAQDTKLFDWNVNVYADLENYLRNNQSALAVICTGGGKTTTALEYLRIHDVKALVIGPSNTIKDSWSKSKKEDDDDGCPTSESDWKDEHVTYMNYQSLMKRYKKIDWSQYSVLICDEAHHIKAKRWGEAVRYVLKNHPNIKIIGLTATPTKEQVDGTDDEFQGRVCYGLEIADGLKEGKIWPFSYISSIYKMDDVKEEFESYGEEGRLLWERLSISLNKNPVSKILKRHMPSGQRKIIVFCSSINDIPDAKEAMLNYNKDLEIKIITSKEDKDDNDEAKKWFNNEKDKDVCLITVSMVNEGAHYNGINTLVMFRRTNSLTLYLQQLGRIIVLATKDNPNGIVFDFTNNAENLIANSTAVNYSNTSDTSTDQIKKIKETIKSLSGQEVIHRDYTENCVETLTALKEAKDYSKQSTIIYNTFSEFKDELNKELENIFDFGLWSNLKTNKKLKVGSKPAKRASSDKTRDAFNKVNLPAATKQNIQADDIDRITVAFKTALRRSYEFNYIDFLSKDSFNYTVIDRESFNNLFKSFGFIDITVVENVMKKLDKHTFIIATNID